MELLYPHFLAWLLVFFRLTGIFVFAPVLSSKAVPAVVKVLLVAGLSFCVYPMLLSTGGGGVLGMLGILEGGLNLWTLLPVVAGEMMFGWVIGYCASLPMVGIQVGGGVLDQQMGITAGGLFNPDFDAEMAVSSSLLYAAATFIFVLMGGHHVMIAILVGSFETFPVAGLGTGAATLDPAFLLNLVLGLMGVVFDMALRIAAPMLCIIFLQSVGMGFISRTVPQMNILSVGFVVRILGGIAILIVGIEGAMGVFSRTMRPVLQELMRAFGGG